MATSFVVPGNTEPPLPKRSQVNVIYEITLYSLEESTLVSALRYAGSLRKSTGNVSLSLGYKETS